MIRPAGPEDLPALLRMSRRFIETAWVGLFEWHEPSVIDAMRAMHILLVLERDGRVCGMIGGMVIPLYIDRRQTIAQEMMWWVEPEARGRGRALLPAFEAAAKALGATVGGLNNLEAMRAKDVGRVYRRMGYRPVEQAWMKRL